MAGAGITLRAARIEDRFLVHRWLGDAEVVAWFGSRASADAVVAMARESGSAQQRIVELEGRPIGYAQAVDVGEATGPLPAALVAGICELDMFIGAADARGRGYGAQAAGLLRDELFATTLAVAVAVLVPIRREDAVRRLEKVGFRWREVWADPARGRCWVLVSERAT